MTQEEKQLLLKDLCARIPYDLVVNVKDLGDVYLASVDWWEEVGVKDYTNTLYPLDDVKPYLRSISNMTEDEVEEWERIVDVTQNWLRIDSIPNAVNFFNKHHLDYHNLIEKGLALEAPANMYNI